MNMKRFGTITTIALALGLGITGFSSTASAASTCPVQPVLTYQYQWIPYMFQMPMVPQQGFPQQVPLQPRKQPQAPIKYQWQTAPAKQAPVNNQWQTAPAKQGTKQADASAYAKQVADLVNQERAKAGLSPLKFDDALSKVAQAKAADMAQNHYFDHTSPTYGSPFDMMKQYGITFRTAGENIAMGQRSPEEVMNQWMNSDGHRKNILNPSFTKIGVGYVNGYWVQEFNG